MANKPIKPAERLSLVQEYYFSRKLKEVAQLNAEGKDIISLAIGSPDMPPSEQTIEKLCETARVSSKTVENKDYTVVKIGGIGNANGKRYVICFHHEDKEDGDIWVMIVGNNQAGFQMAFAKDKDTVVDAEVKAMPNDEDGTLIIYEEEVIGD